MTTTTVLGPPTSVEDERVAALHAHDILDTDPEPEFERLVRLIRRTLGVPIATVSFVDRDRVWFKASRGLPMREVPRDGSFSDVAIRTASVTLVPDTRLDTRMADNAFRTGEHAVRFFAGAPIVTSDGHRVGAINAMDFEPRHLTLPDIRNLQDLAALAADLLASRTDRHRNEAAAAERLRTEAVRARKASESKTAFFRRLSHELRTPLNAVIGFSDLLLEQTQGNDREFVGHIRSAGENLLALVSEASRLSRYNSEGDGLLSEPVDLAALAGMTVAGRNVSGLPAAATVHAETGDDPAWVLGNTEALTEVLDRLLDNALTHGGDGVAVTLTVATTDDHVTVSVADDGPGIDPADHERIFGAFERGANAARGGLGMGLTIVLPIVKRLGGWIEVASTLGGGTRFDVVLPREDRPEERATSRAVTTAAPRLHVTPDEPRLPATGTPPGPTVDADVASEEAAVTGISVLYVDDNEANRFLVQRILARMDDVRLRTLPTGAEAAGVLHGEEPFDVVLLDLNLPDIDGRTLLGQLRADERYDDVPVAMVSADVHPQSIQQLMADGADAYFGKPVRGADLKTLVRQVTSVPGPARREVARQLSHP